MKVKLALIMAVIGLVASGLTVYAAGASKDTVDVGAFMPGPATAAGVPQLWPPSGDTSATLIRNNNGISMNIHTNGLPEGAYTVWWIIFNHPAECDLGAGNCGLVDLGNPDVAASVNRAAGKIVNNGDNANFAGSLSVGDDDHSQGGFGPGILDTSEAEVHNVIRFHGPALPGNIPAMIHTVGGECNNPGPGSFPCFDPQSVVYPLPQ